MAYLDNTGAAYFWGKVKGLNISTFTNDAGYLTTHQDISSKADKATTLSGYGITDAKIENGVITLGNNTITPLTSHQDISGKVNKSGDTMTGILTQTRTNSSYYISRSDTYAKTTASNNGISSNQDIGGLLFRDKNDSNIGDVHLIMNASGSVQLELFAQNMKTDGTQFSNAFNIFANKDGSATYSMSSPANFRSAISAPAMVSDTYPTLLPTNGSNHWIKVGTANTSFGILPSQGGNAGNGHNNIGTSTWYWKCAYIDNVYCSNLAKIATQPWGKSLSFTPSSWSTPCIVTIFSNVLVIFGNGSITGNHYLNIRAIANNKYKDKSGTGTVSISYTAAELDLTIGATISQDTSGTITITATGNTQMTAFYY